MSNLVLQLSQLSARRTALTTQCNRGWELWVAIENAEVKGHDVQVELLLTQLGECNVRIACLLDEVRSFAALNRLETPSLQVFMVKRRNELVALVHFRQRMEKKLNWVNADEAEDVGVKVEADVGLGAAGPLAKGGDVQDVGVGEEAGAAARN